MNNYITYLTLMNIEWKKKSEELPEVTKLEFKVKANTARDVAIPSEEEIKDKLKKEFGEEVVSFKIAKRAVAREDLLKAI